MYDLGLSLDSSFSMLSQSPRCVAAFGGEDGDAHTPGVLSSPAHSGLVFGVLRNRVLFPVLLSTAQMRITRRHQQTVSAADDDLDVITTKK